MRASHEQNLPNGHKLTLGDKATVTPQTNHAAPGGEPGENTKTRMHGRIETLETNSPASLNPLTEIL